MGGSVASAMERCGAGDPHGTVLTRNLVSILENRRREFVARLECKHARGMIDTLQRRVVRLAVTNARQKEQQSQQPSSALLHGGGGAVDADDAGANVFRYKASRLQGGATPPAPSSSAVVDRVSPRDALRDVEPVTEKAVMRVSDILMCTGEAVSKQLSEATAAFIGFCQGGESATRAAASSVHAVLVQQLDTVLGVRDGQEMERDGEFICFMNNAFTKCSYAVYSNAVRGGFGQPLSICGCCYVAEISVLDVSDLESAEVDFLLSQSFFADSGESATKAGDENKAENSNGYAREEESVKQIELIMRMKMLLFESAAVSRLLRRERVPIDELRELMMLMVETQRSATSLFRAMPKVGSSRIALSKKPFRAHESAAAAALSGGVEAGQDDGAVAAHTAWNRRREQRTVAGEKAASRALQMMQFVSTV
jgi:hypothetical protein